jgi:hypothetical protein
VIGWCAPSACLSIDESAQQPEQLGIAQRCEFCCEQCRQSLKDIRETIALKGKHGAVFLKAANAEAIDPQADAPKNMGWAACVLFEAFNRKSGFLAKSHTA